MENIVNEISEGILEKRLVKLIDSLEIENEFYNQLDYYIEELEDEKSSYVDEYDYDIDPKGMNYNLSYVDSLTNQIQDVRNSQSNCELNIGNLEKEIEKTKLELDIKKLTRGLKEIQHDYCKFLINIKLLPNPKYMVEKNQRELMWSEEDELRGDEFEKLISLYEFHIKISENKFKEIFQS